MLPVSDLGRAMTAHRLSLVVLLRVEWTAQLVALSMRASNGRIFPYHWMRAVCIECCLPLCIVPQTAQSAQAGHVLFD